MFVWIGWIIFWEGKAACWMSGTERRKGPARERRGGRRCWTGMKPKPNGGKTERERETTEGGRGKGEGGRREEVMDGKRRRERDRLVLVIGVDGRKKEI